MDDFNKELWETKFSGLTGCLSSLKEDINEIKTTVENLIKISVTAIIAVCGWSLIQIYGNVVTKAHAETLPAPSVASNTNAPIANYTNLPYNINRYVR